MLSIRIWEIAASMMLSAMTVLSTPMAGECGAYAGIQPAIRCCGRSGSRQDSSPPHGSGNILNRQSHAPEPEKNSLLRPRDSDGRMKKRLTGSASAQSRHGRRIIFCAVNGRNDDFPVFQAFDPAAEADPETHPLFHSGRAFQIRLERAAGSGACRGRTLHGQRTDGSLPGNPGRAAPREKQELPAAWRGSRTGINAIGFPPDP